MGQGAMNYQKLYDVFIAKKQARNKRKIPLFTHRHHIIPRSFGGPDDESNLVALTVLEHIYAHRLLAYIHGGKMWVAYSMMIHINGKTLSEEDAAQAAEQSLRHVLLTRGKALRVTFSNGLIETIFGMVRAEHRFGTFGIGHVAKGRAKRILCANGKYAGLYIVEAEFLTLTFLEKRLLARVRHFS